MLTRKNVFAFNSCLIILITFTLVSIASQTINLDGDSTAKSSSTFVYYETTTQLNDNLVNTLDHNLTNLNNLPPISTINPEQFTNSSGFVTENATKTIDYPETIKPDNGDNRVNLLTTINPDDNQQSTPSWIPLIEELLLEQLNNQPDQSTSESIEMTSKQSTDYEPIAQPEVTIDNLYLTVDDQRPTTTESNQAKTTITFAESKLPLTPQSTEIYSIATQSTPSIFNNNTEVETTTNDVETIKLITGQEMISTTTEKVNSESIQQSTSLPVTIKPSLTTTMIDDVETRQSTIDLPITTESNLIFSTIQAKSTTPLYSEITTTITSESNQPTTFKTTTESPQSSENNEVTSTITYNDESTTTITTTDWVQSTTSDAKSDDNTTPTTSWQFPTSIATESSFTTETTTETIQSTTFQTQTEPQLTTTFRSEIETTTESRTTKFRPEIEPITERFTTTFKPEIETTTESRTTKFRPEIEPTTERFTTTFRPAVKTTTEQITTRTEPQLTTTTIKPQIITEQFITTIKPEIETTTPSTIIITIKPDEPATGSNISCDCNKSNFDGKPHCKFTCASSTVLAGIHINLTLFGIKLATILSNRDYVLCIAIGLGCLLLISGVVLRLIHNKKQRKLIAQRNFEILYQDFGTINEKSKQWLADFSYQSSIL